MAHLISCQSISKAFGAQKLFDEISFGISEGERLGLIGPNGSGKSTLLKIFCGQETPDQGKIFLRKNVRLVYLAQAEKFKPRATVEEILLQALSGQQGMSDSERYAEVQQMAGKCGFYDPRAAAGDLSGGWLKRLAIGCALIQRPDLLLMDEPTNHLDMEGILWLETLLKKAPYAFVVISHDRYFLENVTNRIIELSGQYPGGHLRVEGNFQEFLRRKEQLLISQNKQETILANQLRREIEWLSRGPKARTTKAQYRIDDAGRLKDEFTDVRGRNIHNRKIDIGFDATNRRTKKLLTVNNISKAYGEKQIFAKLNLELTPGTCIGILGNNGSGKSTLMHILAGRLAADQGTVKEADGLKLTLFDQKRADLDPQQSLRRALAPEGDSVLFKGQPLHVVSWAQRFLFRPDQLDMPISRLSGGEQARILIANLMRQQVDVLLLDEPTNDLDIPSLEVLEEGLAEFPGAIILVSHDRFLLDRLADFVLGFDGQGGCERYADFRQWLAAINQEPVKRKKSPDKGGKASSPAAAPKKKKLTFGEELELEKMEAKIAQAEATLAACQDNLASREAQSAPETLSQACQDLRQAQENVEALYRRWQQLEEKAAG